MAISGADFKKALQHWGSGVAVVATQSEKFGAQGMTVTAFCSLSVNPPQILVCINESADTGEGIKESGHFSVNVLKSDQDNISNQFAGGSSQQQRFENTTWEAGNSGMPILSESLMSLVCKVVDIIPSSGTHNIIIGEVEDTVCRDGEPLLYYRSAYHKLAAD
ncbi:MAG: flavin reductase family protein [Gammaproteobacteria bacterium]